MRDTHEAKAFGARLAALLKERGMNYSDLARAVFGEMKDANGYTVARNRQSIGRYIAGKLMPDQQTRERIATALQVPYGDLFNDNAPQDRPGSGIALTQVAPGVSRLTIDAKIPTDIALEVIRLIAPHT